MNAAEVIRACRENGLSLSGYALARESAQNGLSGEDIRSRFRQMLAVMETSAQKALAEPVRSVSGLTGGDAYLYEQRRRSGSLLGGAAAKAVAFALSRRFPVVTLSRRTPPVQCRCPHTRHQSIRR